MRHLLFLLLATGISLGLSAQKFRPYHAFGFDISINRVSLSTQDPEDKYIGGAGPDLTSSIFGFDAMACYDYGILPWFGISSGLGAGLRGGSGTNYNIGRRNTDYSMHIYYLNLPIKLQIKPAKWFWIEPGVEIKYVLSHQGNGIDTHSSRNSYEFDTFNINWLAVMRFNLFRGISLSLSYHHGLDPIATVTMEDNGQVYSYTSYTDRGLRIGFRYIFNQPR